MRVNICYSVKIEEIPEVVNGLLKEVSQRLISLSEQALAQESLLRDGDSIQHAQEIVGCIEGSREKLTDLDRRLSDLMSVYMGYYQAITNPEQALEQLQQLNETISETADELEEASSGVEEAMAQAATQAPALIEEEECV